MSQPLVSIITPSYNQAAFLEQTLQSVLEQDYPNLEYLVVDGASTDGSVEIIRRYAGRLAWWVSEPDSGQAEAINKGLRRAQGEYVAWLNSDDLYLPRAVAGAAAALQADPALGLVYGDAQTVDGQGALINRLYFGAWGLLDLLSFRIICQPAVFMRRTVLERTAAAQGAAGAQPNYLDPSFHFMLDHQLWLQMARLAPIRHVPQTWAAARHHSGAKNVAQSAAFGQEIFRLVDWMQAQPDLAPLVASNRRRVLGGAHRLNARYLLDGGQAGPALRAYAQALRYNPRFALQHWRRMLYAAFSLAAGPQLAQKMDRWRTARTPGGEKRLV